MIIMRADGTKQRLVDGRVLPYRWYHALLDRIRLWQRRRAWRRHERECGCGRIK